MSTRDSAGGRLEIGSLVFDPGTGEISGPKGVERIAPKPASLLRLLASRPGALVTRDEMRDHLWPGGKVEFEQGIAFAVREVRKAIEATGGDPAVIETIPKRGFRLAVSTRVVGPSLASEPAAPRTAWLAGAASTTKFMRPLVALAVAAGIASAVLLPLLSSEQRPASLPVAVVFAHDVEDAAHEDLATALAFELTTALTRALAGALGIVGPTGTSILSGPDDSGAARDAMGACLVVSGGIRAIGTDSIVVFTQVVRTSDRVHVWAAQDTVSTSLVAAVVVPNVVDGVASAAGGC